MREYIYKSILATVLLTTATLLQARTMDEQQKDTICNVVVRFEQNQSQISKHVAGNEDAIAFIDSLLTDSLQLIYLDSITITAYASPDGAGEKNNQLSTCRKENIQAYLQQHYPQLDANKIHANHQQEDWSGLHRWIINDPRVPDKEDVIALINFHHTDKEKLKRLLKQLNQGKAYSYLKRQILPQLCRADLRFYSTQIQQPKEKEIVATATVLQDTLLTHQAAHIEDAPKTQRVVVAIKNNLLYDLALAPNLEIEVPLGSTWSINAEYKCPWWQNSHKEWCYQLMSGGVEGRYWLGNRLQKTQLAGHFIGVYAEGGSYDLQIKGDGYQGDYYIASGLSYGYTKPLGAHLSIEFSLGVGYLTTEYRRYTPYQGSLVGVKSGKYNWIGPTKAKISLAWLIKTRR